MKNLFKLILVMSLLISGFANAQVGIGTTTPHPSAILEISSTTGGLLLPRLTNSQRSSIATPAVGLLIYNTSINCLEWYTGSAWVNACNVPFSATRDESSSSEGFNNGPGLSKDIMPVNNNNSSNGIRNLRKPLND